MLVSDNVSSQPENRRECLQQAGADQIRVDPMNVPGIDSRNSEIVKNSELPEEMEAIEFFIFPFAFFNFL
jgi:hypothetical protein